MEYVVHAALEEICSRGINGLPLHDLWPKLHFPLSSHGLHLCLGIKKSLWANLIEIPGLQFQSPSQDTHDPSGLSLEDCERLGLRIVAPEHLRNCFVGIYDVKASDAGVSQPQRRVLERLAIARTNGITQSELAKEFGIKGNNIFYILRNLECRGLIVRQSTIVRKKESYNDGEPKSSSIVTTNMLHLYRYAKHLGCQQRLEITKEDKTLMNNENADGTAMNGDGIVRECGKEDVQIKDYLPALKAICDKLEKADGKVLLVSDIKRDLDYRGTSGHRAWRNICNRLKDARVVEEFCAKVNKKEVSCLRLLKKFSPKNFEPKTVGCGFDDLEAEQLLKLGKRGQITEALVELPIEQQIYDMIDAEGSKGLTITEVCKRLGISNKRYYTRLLNMFSRFGMHLQAESYNRCVAYRVWTPGNFNTEASSILTSNPENIFDGNGVHNLDVGELDSNEKSAPISQENDCLASQSEDTATNENKIVATESGNCHALPSHELQIVCTEAELNVASLEISTLSSTPPRRRSYQRYPCLTLSATSAQREQRILEILQEQKFLIKAELHRHLESIEKDKQTMMDRKTLERILNKLQQEGHCKCIRVGVPVVTNFGRTRTTDVVLHPSIYDVSPELLCQIHERLRSFEIQVRSQSSSRMKSGQTVPVLNGVQRILKSQNLDKQAARSEAMRNNGFVLARMVRTKLLHIYMWGYLSSSPGWEDVLSSNAHGYDLKNPHSSCKLFDLDATIKAMPLELFLQVVGSNQKFDDMIEKCRKGLCLSDLPVQEYRCLMDTRATGRLSWLVDILQRLKLIRLVSDGHNEDVTRVPHATLTYALELKPYIEEPVALVTSSSGLKLFDLRPQIRHDFVLSSRKAVDEYWNTLEYSYAAADSKAALHAFPGSLVHEVFFTKSWASVRVMTAVQRAELLKRVGKEGPNQKLSFRDCEKIAKDLNLTLEQVLRIYYDKRKQHSTRLHGNINSQGEDFQPSRHRQASRKRKRLAERGSEHINIDPVDGNSTELRLATVSNTDDQHMEEQNPSPTSAGEYEKLEIHNVDQFVESTAEPESNEQDEEDHSFLRNLSSLKSSRQSKFSWTESADRQLVIEYTRHRAALGANFHRTDWAILPNLPAPPNTCKRRMAILNSSTQFRKSVMRLCNMLSKRYARYLEKFQNKSLKLGDCRLMVRHNHFNEDNSKKLSDGPEHNEGSDPKERWDNFDEKCIKTALDEVLHYKRMAKLDASGGVGSISEEGSVLNINSGNDCHDTELVPSDSCKEGQDQDKGCKVSRRRLSRRHLPRKYVKLLNEGTIISRRAYESLAVSNAVELFKLIFLSTSTAPKVANVLAETLRRYSEHDLFAAFNYLRDKKIMTGGNGSSPFALSQQFLQNLSASPFPISTGRSASKFINWLHERQRDLMEEGVKLPDDLQCGEVFHLFALVSSGEFSITPCLPEEGIGEADSRTAKRKCESNEFYSGDTIKKFKTFSTGEGEIISRREKGFPGISLSLSRATISGIDAVELFKNVDEHAIHFCINDQMNRASVTVGSNLSYPDHTNYIYNSSWSSIPTAVAAGDLLWEAMIFYAKRLVTSRSNLEDNLFHPECFRDVYSAIQKAGDQGLTLEEISEVVQMQGWEMAEIIAEVLEAFGKAQKVIAYDSIRIVDSLYRSKYFLTSVTDVHQDPKVGQSTDSGGIIDDQQLFFQRENQEYKDDLPKEIGMNADEVHRVTILNLPGEVGPHLNEVQCSNEGRDHEDLSLEPNYGDSQLCKPILPWINGDGTVNDIVYKGLVRRLLGVVMQNPGILEDGILSQMHALNPQSCIKLLELMILDKHIIVRKMHQTTSGEPLAMLSSLLGSSFKKSKFICREHFFANPMSTTLL